MNSLHRWFLLLLLPFALVGTACDESLEVDSGAPFVCATNSDCAAGFVCAQRGGTLVCLKEDQISTGDTSVDTAPDVTEPDATDPDVADPDVADPDVTDPDVSDPDTSDTDTTVTTGCNSDPTSCDDGNPCNGVETCDTNTGQCAAGTAVECDDGEYCNGEETCDPADGQCLPGTAVQCAEDALDCTTAVCNETTDACDFEQVADTCLIDGACYAPDEADPNDGCAICDPSTNAFVTAAAGTTCGSCMLCDAAGACSVEDTTCCRSSESEGYWGMCGTTADTLVPTGCQFTRNSSQQHDGSSSSWYDTYACANGAWTKVDSNGGGGPCAGCSPSFENTWSDTCGDVLAATQTCTNACRVADSPIYEGYCGTAPGTYLADGCTFSNSSYSRSTTGAGGGTTNYICDNGTWVSAGGGGSGGPCTGCTPLWRNTWSDDCGNQTDLVLECTDNCRTMDAPIYTGQCGNGQSTIVQNGCTYRKDTTSRGTTSQGGGYSEYTCVDGAWVSAGGNGGGGPCTNCTPYYTDEWSDNCRNDSAKFLDCTAPVQ